MNSEARNPKPEIRAAGPTCLPHANPPSGSQERTSDFGFRISDFNPRLSRLLVVTLFALAMAWVESAVVLYLRTMVNRLDPFQPNPLPQFTGFAFAELIREAATLVMLLTVGWLAGRNLATRLGYALFAFGVWDIFYYVWLVPMTGWPHGLLDWDILFLIPLPWWGPVLAPVLIALMMTVWGVLTTQFEWGARFALANGRVWLCNLAGVGLALYVFMADALRVAPQGARALREMLPTAFNWPLFILALGLMAAPVLQLACQLWQTREAEPDITAAETN
jgi:hypothetical protein